MEYIINGVVKYNPLNGTLYVADSGMDMLTLTRVTSELLLLLIQNNDVALSRDFILSELWEKRGLNASSNNLNNYMSMLRKALDQCGFPDLITTIPKYGFIFEAEVESVEGSDSTTVDEQSVADVHPQVLPFHEPKIKHRPARHYFTPIRIKVMTLILSLLVVVFLPTIYGHYRLQSVRTEIFTYEQCKFYLADDKTREIDRDKIINNFRVIVENNNLNCERKANVYYFADKKQEFSGHVILTDLLSYCPSNSKAPCDNYSLTKQENQNENEK